MEDFGNILAELVKTHPELEKALVDKVKQIIESIKPEDFEEVLYQYLEGALDYAFEHIEFDKTITKVLEPRLIKALGGTVKESKRK